MLGAGVTGTVTDGVAGTGGGAAVGRSAAQAPAAMTATAAAAAMGGSHDRRPAEVGETAARMSASRSSGWTPSAGAAQRAAQPVLDPPAVGAVELLAVGHDAPPKVPRRVVSARWAWALTEPGEMSRASAICRSLRSA